MTGQEELPPLLSVGDVQRRYGMRDPRAATTPVTIRPLARRALCSLAADRR